MYKNLDQQQHTIRVSIEVPNTPRFILSFNKEQYQNVKQFILYICGQTGLDEKQKFLLMLDDSVIVNMESIGLNLVQAKTIMNDQKQQLNNQSVFPLQNAGNNMQSQGSNNSGSDQITTLGTPLLQRMGQEGGKTLRLNPENPPPLIEGTGVLHVTNYESVIPIRKRQPQILYNHVNSEKNDVEIGLTTELENQQQVPQFKNSWHMSLFKIINSYSYRHIIAQVKYAALQNGFRVLAENKEPIIGKDGSHKLFFSCHQKQNKCLFRLQYVRRSINEPFRFYKGRDMHNHEFVEPIQLLKENSNNLEKKTLIVSPHQQNQINLANNPQDNSNLLLSLQQHFEQMNDGLKLNITPIIDRSHQQVYQAIKIEEDLNNNMNGCSGCQNNLGSAAINVNNGEQEYAGYIDQQNNNIQQLI